MGMPVAAFQSEPGKYHISGHLEAAPYAMLKRRFAAIRPILEAAGARPIIIISPLPRFLLKGCCDSATHIPNLSSPDYRRNLEDSIFECFKNLYAQRPYPWTLECCPRARRQYLER